MKLKNIGVILSIFRIFCLHSMSQSYLSADIERIKQKYPIDNYVSLLKYIKILPIEIQEKIYHYYDPDRLYIEKKLGQPAEWSVEEIHFFGRLYNYIIRLNDKNVTYTLKELCSPMGLLHIGPNFSRVFYIYDDNSTTNIAKKIFIPENSKENKKSISNSFNFLHYIQRYQSELLCIHPHQEKLLTCINDGTECHFSVADDNEESARGCGVVVSLKWKNIAALATYNNRNKVGIKNIYTQMSSYQDLGYKTSDCIKATFIHGNKVLILIPNGIESCLYQLDLTKSDPENLISSIHIFDQQVADDLFSQSKKIYGAHSNFMINNMHLSYSLDYPTYALVIVQGYFNQIEKATGLFNHLLFDIKENKLITNFLDSTKFRLKNNIDLCQTHHIEILNETINEISLEKNKSIGLLPTLALMAAGYKWLGDKEKLPKEGKKIIQLMKKRYREIFSHHEPRNKYETVYPVLQKQISAILAPEKLK